MINSQLQPAAATAARLLWPIIAVAIAATLSGAPPAVAATAPTTLYVAQDGADSNRCVTKAEPCRTISHAITLAAAGGSTIHVAKGGYPAIGSPGSKHVTVIGVGTDFNTGTVVSPSNDIDATLDNANGVLTLKSMALVSSWIGIQVDRGTLNTSNVRFALTTCPLYISGGRVTLTDSVLEGSGSAAEGPNDCAPTAGSPVAVTLNGGSLSLVGSSLIDTKGEPGIVVNGGTFSADGSTFSDDAYRFTNPDPALRVVGGATTIKRSLFTKNYSAIESPGGATTISDSTFYDDDVALSAAVPGSQQLVLRSTFFDAEVFGPTRLGADVLVNHGGDPACDEQPEDLGYNYGTQGGCQFNAPSSHNGVATMNLDPAGLAARGGPTKTLAQFAPSALINKIPVVATWGPDHKKLCPSDTTDQRDASRPQGARCDVGAFEAGSSNTTLTARPNPAGKGATVTLRAKITASMGTFHDPDKPAGKVIFKRGTTTLCSGKVMTASGVATCTTTRLPVGRDVVRAAFTSSSTFLGSAASKTVTIKGPRALRVSPQDRP